MDPSRGSHVRIAHRITLVLLLAVGIGLTTACGGASDESDAGGPDATPEVRLVYVSWIEGIAMTHVAKVLLEDSLGVQAPLTQAGGAAFAFSAVAEGDADVFLDAWLPTTHGRLWDEYGDRLADLGSVYDSTTVGLAVPRATDLRTVRDLDRFRDALGGEIIGIESGAAINDQTRAILQEQGLADAFDVVPSSDAAMVSALQRAVDQGEPIVITAWKPHWMWGRFDLRYLDGAQTGQSDVFGAPESIRKVARKDVQTAIPDRALGLLQAMHFDDAAMTRLMTAFQPGEDDRLAAARRWIEAHPDRVQAWMRRARANH